MKLLMISAAFPPMRAGEADHAFHLARHLAERGIDVHVLTTRGNSLRDHAELRLNVHPIMRRWSWSDLPRFARFVRRCAPDAIALVYSPWIYHDHLMITFAPSICRAVLPPVPFLTQFEIGDTPPTWQASLFTRVVRKGVAYCVGRQRADYELGTLLRDSDRLVFLSEHHRDDLTRRLPGAADKSLVIAPPPILYMSAANNGATRLKGRERLGVGPDVFLLAYFGYFCAGKGLEYLLEAFQIVSRQREHARLLMIGGSKSDDHRDTGSYAGMIRRMANQMGIAGKIIWAGDYEWDSEEASVNLRSADACVLPFDDGVKLNRSSLAAAVSHGLPVVTTWRAPLETPFRDGSKMILCPPKDPAALAAAIDSLITSPERRQVLSAAALELAGEWFSWNRAVDRTLEALSAATRRQATLEVTESKVR